jgi:hypothetical protein
LSEKTSELLHDDNTEQQRYCIGVETKIIGTLPQSEYEYDSKYEYIVKRTQTKETQHGYFA